MSTYVIPIKSETLALIAQLNDGVAPAVQNIETVFLYHTDSPAEIMATSSFLAKVRREPRPITPGSLVVIYTYAPHKES